MAERDRTACERVRIKQLGFLRTSRHPAAAPMLDFLPRKARLDLDLDRSLGSTHPAVSNILESALPDKSDFDP